MSTTKIRLAFVGGEHLHFGRLLDCAVASPTADVVGMSIDDDELRTFFERKQSGVPAFRTAEELYDKAKPEAIITCADNLRAAEVIADAAARGVHVMKEKPMAASLNLADRMMTTAARHGVRLMVNWPTNWSPAIHHAKRLVDEGRIGRVWQVHHRAGHGGPPADFQHNGPVSRIGWGWLIEREQNGGGAAIDFCSYGAVLSRWIMGQPARVIALGGRYAKEFFTVEDNAVMVLGYPHGHSICEATWTQPAVPTRIPAMIYGTDGAIALTGQSEIQLANRGQSGERSSTETETIAAPALPDSHRSAPDYFTSCLLHDRPFEGIVSPEISRDAQEILEAGMLSMGDGKEVGLPLPAFLA
ncbi:MAG: Gfo/Idh/MocA family protein [Thermomicrobiales bacterium]